MGLALIASIHDGYILAWPVTPGTEKAYAPALVVDHPCLGNPLHLWPTRETGISMGLLGEKVRHIFGAPMIAAISHGIDTSSPVPFQFANGSAVDAENRDADAAMVSHWADLCFLEPAAA
jgi:hypothetical protein